jgi:hypothetical protein
MRRNGTLKRVRPITWLDGHAYETRKKDFTTTEVLDLIFRSKRLALGLNVLGETIRSERRFRGRHACADSIYGVIRLRRCDSRQDMRIGITPVASAPSHSPVLLALRLQESICAITWIDSPPQASERKDCTPVANRVGSCRDFMKFASRYKIRLARERRRMRSCLSHPLLRCRLRASFMLCP